MSFWEKVEQECKYRGISRKELAAAAHFSVNTIATGLKRDGMPAADLALRISKVLEVPLENLLESDDSAVSEQDISDIHQKQKLLSRYLSLIDKLEHLPPQTVDAILTVVDSINI